MKTPGSISNTIRVLFALTVGWFGAVLPARAHFCGPPVIHLQVGQTCPWQIIADHIETTSLYIPQLAGTPGVVAVTPLKTFQTRHADFTITGKAPGTNVLVVNWSYQPTGGAGICVVQIIVTADDQSARPDRPQCEGALCTSVDMEYIYGRFLREMLDHYIPAVTPKLLVLTECFGGDIVASGHFKNATNLAIASGTSANQEGKYGGYHDDASRALKPGEGRTARDVHEAGAAGKWIVEPEDATADKSLLHFLGEWPQTGGGLSLDNLSLAPVTVEGPVRSRHIVAYAGKPTVKRVQLQTHAGGTTVNHQEGPDVTVSDNADRDTIKANFAGQPNTTVRTVGGGADENDPLRGQDGWDFPGTRDGLRRAIEEAGNAIRASAHPELEQFILYVGDHGMPGRGDTSQKKTHAAARSVTEVATDQMFLNSDESLIDQLLRQPDNQPGFLVFAQPSESRSRRPTHLSNALDPARLGLSLMVEGTSIRELHNPHLTADDLEGDGEVSAEEGWTLFFPLDEWSALNQLADVRVSLALNNESDLNLVVSAVTFSGGAIERGSTAIPPPWILRATRQSNGALNFTARWHPGRSYVLESSTELEGWSAARTIVATSRIQSIEHTPASTAQGEFYRLRLADQ